MTSGPGFSAPIEFDPGSVRRVARSAWPDTFEATVHGREVVVFRCGTEVFAVSRFCPHQGADLTRRGFPDAERRVVICLAHAHTYRFSDGACTKADTCAVLPVFPVDSDLLPGNGSPDTHSSEESQHG